jgi:3-methyladenine DNA glycosylase/8-oxoguanine DNA glycosylase
MNLGPIGLKKLGLSTAKASFLMGAAELWKDRSRKRLPALQAGIEEVETLLGELPGVGPWTLDMLRIFALGKPDIFPVGDYGLKSGIAELFGMTELPDKAQLFRIGEPWAPYRTFATWYIWRSKGNVPQS